MNNAPSVISMPLTPNEATIRFVRDLGSRGFWGNVTIKFQHGDAVHLVIEESVQVEKLIAPDTRRNHRDDNR